MLQRFLNSKTKTVTFAAFLLAGFSLLSRLLGIVRNNLLGNVFPKEQTDIYLAAFRLPDLVYGILITGGIVAAFLPVFSTHFKKSRQEAQELLSNVLSIFLLCLIGLSLILAIFAPQLSRLLVPGFSAAQKETTVGLMRIMFLSPVILGISAIFSAVLQYFDLFFAYSLAPVFYNLGIIVGIVFLSPIFGLKGVALGVILGALLHLLIQLPPIIKKGLKISLSFRLSRGLAKIFRLMLPRTIGAAGFHINLIIITAIASTLAAGSIRVFAFANDLYAVPLGLVGISFATAVFPTLSRHFASQEKEQFLEKFFSAFSQIVFLALPITVLIFMFRAQIVRLFYGTQIIGAGYFDWQDTRLTAASLGIFCLAILASCLIPLLSRAFFALQDTKTPVKIALLTIGLNIVAAFYFTWALINSPFFQQITVSALKLQSIETNKLAVIGLPLSVVLAALFQVALLLVFFKRKVKQLNFSQYTGNFFKILLLSVLLAPLSWIALRFFALLLDTNTVLGILSQLGFSALICLGFYLFLAKIFKCPQISKIVLDVKRQFQHEKSH